LRHFLLLCLNVVAFQVPVDVNVPRCRSQAIGTRKLLPLSQLQPVSVEENNRPSKVSVALLKKAQTVYGNGNEWARTAFHALDYSNNGTVGPEDFDLTARRQPPPSPSVSQPESDDAAKSDANEEDDEFDDLPAFDQAPRLRAHLSTWDGVGTTQVVGAAEVFSYLQLFCHGCEI
jgi:hypothetical protein